MMKNFFFMMLINYLKKSFAKEQVIASLINMKQKENFRNIETPFQKTSVKTKN